MQCVQQIYMFLDEIEQIKIQALNKRHYNAIIPHMLYIMNSFGQKLISLNQRQLAVYNIPMRTQRFFNHYSLNDLSYASFAVVKETVIIVGGVDFLAEGDATKPGYQTLLIDLPLYDR